MLVQRLERAPVDVPVQLLADEGEVDQLDERRLQLVADLMAVVFVERRQMRLTRDRCHLSSFGTVQDRDVTLIFARLRCRRP